MPQASEPLVAVDIVLYYLVVLIVLVNFFDINFVDLVFGSHLVLDLVDLVHMDTITGVGMLLFIMLAAGLMTHYVDGI